MQNYPNFHGDSKELHGVRNTVFLVNKLIVQNVLFTLFNYK